MMGYDYVIADLRMRSNCDLGALGLGGFRPFAQPQGGKADCSLRVTEGDNLAEVATTAELSSSYLAEADAYGRLYRTQQGYLYSISASCGDTLVRFHVDISTKDIVAEMGSECDVAQLRFGLWIMFGVVLALHGGIAFHSSAIECGGKVVLFLGESGTGKSTHTRLWRENIEEAHLLNDDSPIVRIVNGEIIAYGSPWSGKTPCYKNLSYPVAAFCRLSQASENRISRLTTIAALGALLPSTPPQFAHDAVLQDSICSTLGELLRRVPAFHLACLPDASAARLVYETIIKDETGAR